MKEFLAAVVNTLAKFKCVGYRCDVKQTAFLFKDRVTESFFFFIKEVIEVHLYTRAYHTVN